MKKIFILITACFSIFSLTGCDFFGKSTKDYVKEIISDELHNYVFDSTTDYTTGEVTYYDTIHNDVATAILLLNGYLTVNLESLFEKADSSIDEVTVTYENMYIYDINTAFNMILVYQMLNLDLTDLTSYLSSLKINDLYTPVWEYDFITDSWIIAKDEFGNEITELSPYTMLTAINCFNMLDTNSSLKESLIKKFSDFSSFSYMDADFASLVAVSMQGNADSDYLDYIRSQITATGVANFSGDSSCTTTSQALIALLSNGVLYKNNILVDYILEFKVDGGFSEYLDEGTKNVSFASPKAFCALVTAYLFDETSNKILFY